MGTQIMCGHLWSQDYHGEGVPCPFCLHDELAKEKARAEKAEAKARILADHVAKWSDKSDELGTALAAARRETALYRGVIDNLLSVMEMQEKRESGEFHITGEVMWGIWSDSKSQARAALAAPASGEEGKR